MAQGGGIVIAVPEDIAAKVLFEGYRCSRRGRVPASRNRDAALRAYRRCQPSRPPVLLEVVSLPAGVDTSPHKDGIKLSTAHLPGNCLTRAPRPGSVPASSGVSAGLTSSFQPPVRTASLRPPAPRPSPPSWTLAGMAPGSRANMGLDQIFFSQDSIMAKFRDGRSLELMERELRSGQKSVGDIPTITVVYHNDRYYTVDNRRLHVFKRVFHTGQVPVIIGERDHRFHDKLTTTNGGTSIRVRGRF